MHRGNLSQTAVTAETLPDKLAVRWSFPTDRPIDGTAAIANGVVYVGSDQLYAIDLKTGKEKWKFASGAIKSPVSIHDGKVFVGNDDGVMHCVDATTGKSLWKFEAGRGDRLGLHIRERRRDLWSAR